MKEALVLAHGAFHGPWCWDAIIPALEDKGIHCLAVDLNRGGLHADRDALQQSVEMLRAEYDRVHAIGHSLGCPSVALIDPGTIATATFLAGPLEGPEMPPAADCTFPNFVSQLVPQQDGRSFMSREDCDAAFYHRCTREQADWALEQLRPTFVYGGEAVATPIWKAIPVTYIECTDDRAVRPDYQKAAASVCPFSASLDADHSPMLGQPEALNRIILEAIGRAG